MPLILPGNIGSTTAATGYDVANSVRFDTNAYMHKTPGSAGSLTTWTFSTWIKRAKLGSSQYIFTSRNDGNNQTFGYFNSDDTILFFDIDGNADQGKLITNRLFRDVGAWYHLAFIWNTTSGTAGDRIQLWVNGVRETSFSTQTNPDQNDASTMGDAHIIEVGRGGENENYANFYMAETVYQNNSAASPVDVFGEFDSDSGIWKPKDVSGLTFGTNGFYLDFEASGNMGNDANGGTDLTEVNVATTDQSIDTCTNNFATLSPLRYAIHTLAEGNLQYTAATSAWKGVFSTIGVSTGKWYCEVKYSSLDGSTFRFYTGIADARDFNTVHKVGQNESGRVGDTIGFLPDASSPDVLKNGSDAGGSWSTMSVNDILGMAIDCDNGALYFSKNGTWENSSDPESGASKTGAITFTVGETYLFGFGTYGDSSPQQQVNFGSPIHSISSGNTDGDGYGNFEYAVPSGYFSINTKNLAEYG